MARGTLRVYLGAAPGVGKTFAMLDEGWRRRQRGGDVVVGIVETHGRANTQAHIRDLEVVPRRKLEHRGAMFEEMDLDAILARRPERVLVDELAHTNVPGCRNTKRWQDVEELLAAGIDVITTVNIQHLESLNDVVAQITGVTQRETVPDSVVRAADQIELVDMSPEALRRRMAHGNIYAPEKIDAALSNYFRVGNLSALRELALLWVADRVDESLQDYRDRHGIAEPWETKERVVVALTGAPGSDDLVRRAARMAMRAKGELVGVHVQSGDGLADARADALDAHRRLLDELGGRYREVLSSDVATALVEVARGENATQIVLGASGRSRLTELVRGSVINRVIRLSGRAIDVHVISTRSSTGEEARLGAPRRRPTALPRRRRTAALVAAAVGPAAVTIALLPVRDSIGLQNAVLCFLLLVVGVATAGGLAAGTASAVIAFLCLNWFFTPPIHTFTIDQGRDVFSLVTFLVTATVISTLVDLAARRRHDATRARSEAEALGRMAGHVLRERDPVPDLLADLVATFDLDGATVLVRANDAWDVASRAGADPPTSTSDGQSFPLDANAVVVLRSPPADIASHPILSAFVTQLTIAVESRRLHAEAASAEALASTNEMRTALLAAVSHDLRTPLASIKTSATSLLSTDINLPADAKEELLRTIDTESDRLNALVDNLLDMSRIQTGVVPVHQDAVSIDDVVTSAMNAIPDSSRVVLDLGESPPLARADGALLERVIANLVANALSFSPDDHPVRIEAGTTGRHVEIRIVDRGAGIDTVDRERVFRPFQRLGDNPQGSGVGLGLAVARGFVEAMDGSLTVEETPGGGCTMVVALQSSPA